MQMGVSYPFFVYICPPKNRNDNLLKFTKMKKIFFSAFLSIMILLPGCSSGQNSKKSQVPAKKTENEVKPAVAADKFENMTKVLIKTSMGDITIALYDETPLHKENFIKLVNDNFYNDVLFHRIIQGFMIQAGDPNSKQAKAGEMLGNGGPGYTIPAEIVPTLTHKRGAVAAARMGDQVNPKKESSGSQFYIVDGMNGAPHLNGDYTIFGEVISGMEVVDKIALTATNSAERPVRDIFIVGIKPV